MIKVLQVNVDDMGFGGVFSLVKSVIENKPEDVLIDIACIEQFENSKNIEYLNSLGTRVFFIGSTKNKLAKQFDVYSNLLKLIKENGYDCVHIHSDVANKLYVCGKAAKAAGIKKIILHSHASGVDGNHRFLKKIFHKFSRRKLKKIGTHFLACSSLAAEWMFPGYCDRVRIINNGVNLAKFRFSSASRQEARRVLGIGDELLIGHIGRFAYQKNHEYLIEVFAALSSSEKSAKLLLVGEGELQEKIKALAERKNLSDRVIFYGLSREVEKLMQAMDVFVLPSHFEGLPIVGVEAQAAGLPCIFSDAITREVALTDNVLFLPADSASVSAWAEGCKRLASLPRKDNYEALRKQHFDISDTVAELVGLYRSEN